mmetsp:Transcript_37357/g.106921  ORF Transcript_37357/g.106921 Transcript_37357/m.106921 type:complete len:274 (-) Transcript_37357:307-1128(-)
MQDVRSLDLWGVCSGAHREIRVDVNRRPILAPAGVHEVPAPRAPLPGTVVLQLLARGQLVAHGKRLDTVDPDLPALLAAACCLLLTFEGRLGAQADAAERRVGLPRVTLQHDMQIAELLARGLHRGSHHDPRDSLPAGRDRHAALVEVRTSRRERSRDVAFKVDRLRISCPRGHGIDAKRKLLVGETHARKHLALDRIADRDRDSDDHGVLRGRAGFAVANPQLPSVVRAVDPVDPWHRDLHLHCLPPVAVQGRQVSKVAGYPRGAPVRADFN